MKRVATFGLLILLAVAGIHCGVYSKASAESAAIGTWSGEHRFAGANSADVIRVRFVKATGFLIARLSVGAAEGNPAWAIGSPIPTLVDTTVDAQGHKRYCIYFGSLKLILENAHEAVLMGYSQPIPMTKN